MSCSAEIMRAGVLAICVLLIGHKSWAHCGAQEHGSNGKYPCNSFWQSGDAQPTAKNHSDPRRAPYDRAEASAPLTPLITARNLHADHAPLRPAPFTNNLQRLRMPTGHQHVLQFTRGKMLGKKAFTALRRGASSADDYWVGPGSPVVASEASEGEGTEKGGCDVEENRREAKQRPTSLLSREGDARGWFSWRSRPTKCAQSSL